MAHARLAAVIVLSALSIAACARTRPTSPSMHQALAAADAPGTPSPPAAAAVRPSFGYQAPYTPLVVPPDVRRVWITTHVTEEGTLVQGHWVFLPVKTWQWFVEQPLGSNGLGIAVPPDATPSPWPAPITPSRQSVVPWTLDSKAPPSSGQLDPAREPPTPDATPATRAGDNMPAQAPIRQR